MTIKVHPLQPADIPAFVRLELEAFRTHPRMPMLWPRGFTPDLYAYYEDSKTQSLQKEASRIIKAVDDETGEIVAVAQWTFALDGKAEGNRTVQFTNEQPPANWPEGGNWELRRFFKMEWEAWRAAMMGEKPYIRTYIIYNCPRLESTNTELDQNLMYSSHTRSMSAVELQRNWSGGDANKQTSLELPCVWSRRRRV